MSPTIYIIPNHYKGDTFDEITFTIKEDDVVKDLTGVAINMTFRSGSTTGTAIKVMTIGAGITLSDPANGVFKVDAFLNDWDKGLYYYDTTITFTDATVITYINGTLTVIQDVTNG